jgi:hypothetical protein
MEREEAIIKLKQLEGKDLHMAAAQYEVTVEKDGKQNKGWVGHVCERHLGLPLNSSTSPNFGSWELKSVPLIRRKNGLLVFKETMAITMIDPYHVKLYPFEKSHLLTKLSKLVIVARIFDTHFSKPTFVHSVTSVDLVGNIFDTVRSDYELVRACLLDPKRGFSGLTGKMGVYVQPRTKGPGHGSTSRAFYARTLLLEQFIDLGN